METRKKIKAPEKIPTGIEGVEQITLGGVVKSRATLVVGTSGSGKTLFSIEFIYRSITKFNRKAVFVSMEEDLIDIISNVKDLGWDLDTLEDEGKLRFLDAAPKDVEISEVGNYNLEGFLIQLQALIKEIDAEVLVLDSMGSLFQQFANTDAIRREILRLIRLMKKMGITTFMTAERLEEYGLISRHGIEEFVSDNVFILRNSLEGEQVRRTIQVLKMRGATHATGEYPFTIAENGISILPISSRELKQSSSMTRMSFGNDDLNKMTNGGLFKDSILLISGPTGSGKTLMCATFANEGCKNGEKVLMFAYEESPMQLRRNAASWGYDFEKWEDEGLLKIISLYPEAMGLEEHLLNVQKASHEFSPQRLIMDSVSAMERVSSIKIFREFVIGITSFLKHEEICSMMTSTTPSLSGGDSITETHISTITDIIIILRYVEIIGELRRGIAVIKMRGSQHEKSIREFTIDEKGLTIGKPFKLSQSILLTSPNPAPSAAEGSRLQGMFKQG